MLRGFLLQFLHAGKAGEVYNIGGHNEKTNMEITRAVLEKLGKPESLIRYVQDRPGHDKRYTIDASKIERDLGWMPSYTFETGLYLTIAWYQANEAWWRPLKERGLDAKRAAEANQVAV